MCDKKEVKIEYIGQHVVRVKAYVFFARVAYDIIQALYRIAKLDLHFSKTINHYDEFVSDMTEMEEELSKPLIIFPTLGNDD